ncbi:very short patch repair endonuclease [Brevundimonas sp. PAMC22021]|nr:very short patch repair endonuclease [Brevundimonas sp. PAMC22021]QYF86214.1 very short patch repair endonuclease [Brevundimonas sp. PAMC22021]
MARIRRADTKPEMIVRRTLHASGYRFRLQWKAAPGRPDVAFPGRRAIIFVHGCFWHQHPGCRHARLPATRRDFWEAKFDRNRARDARDLARAEAEGWRSLVLWECEIADREALGPRLEAFVGPVRRKRSRPTGLDLALPSEEGRIPRQERIADPRLDDDGA